MHLIHKMIALVHDAGAYAFHHSDGAVRKIIPDTYEHEVYNVDSMKGLETFFKAVT